MGRAVKFRPDPAGQLAVTTTHAGWRYLEMSVLDLVQGEESSIEHSGREIAIVPLDGHVEVRSGSSSFDLGRNSVFSDDPSILYLPPGKSTSIVATSGAAARDADSPASSGRTRVAIGTAPAEGRYPARLFAADEMRLELRGGGSALRQVTHVLAAPLPAERLIVYEIVAPRGTWCGWPPHCHDGYDSSPYLEEVYYFRFDPVDGFAFHRNYRLDTSYDETFVAEEGDVVLVPQGFHTTVASAGSHMYFLNFLAGEPVDEERALPPCFDARFAWISEDWDAGTLTLPTRADAGATEPG
jgi:5-deoxy-glucuronate isomerase